MRRADALIVSHQDLDHSGGARSLLAATPVGWFASSLPDTHPVVELARQRALAFACVAGQTWTWDDVRFTMLHPTQADYEDRYAKTNDLSCVVRIDSSHGSALIAGDIEARAEAVLLRAAPALLRADVLVVPHHGSRTSSTHAFVRAVAPDLAVIGCGYRNRFGHPRPDIVARYTNRGTRVVRTDLEGAIALTFAADAPLVPESARAQRARYWLDLPSPLPAPPD